MSQSFSIKTLWRSFFCALVATVTLSVGPETLPTGNPRLTHWAGDEPLPNRETCALPGHV